MVVNMVMVMAKRKRSGFGNPDTYNAQWFLQY